MDARSLTRMQTIDAVVLGYGEEAAFSQGELMSGE